MKRRHWTTITLALLGFCACSENSNPSKVNGEGPGASIESEILGTWIRNPGILGKPDTLFFGANDIDTPFFNAYGYSAKNGLVKVGPDSDLKGEYLLAGDTLLFEPIHGFPPVPKGIDKQSSARYLRKLK